MIQMINKLKKNQKGFTLVELIVVLVILAILAAFTIPAMLGFVNDAKGKAYVAEAREIYMAYQGAASEVSSSSNTPYTGSYQQSDAVNTPIQKSAFAKLDGDLVTGDTPQTNTQWKVDITSGKVTKVQYVKGGYKVTIDYAATGGSGTAVIEKGGTI